MQGFIRVALVVGAALGPAAAEEGGELGGPTDREREVPSPWVHTVNRHRATPMAGSR